MCSVPSCLGWLVFGAMGCGSGLIVGCWGGLLLWPWPWLGGVGCPVGPGGVSMPRFGCVLGVFFLGVGVKFGLPPPLGGPPGGVWDHSRYVLGLALCTSLGGENNLEKLINWYVPGAAVVETSAGHP